MKHYINNIYNLLTMIAVIIAVTVLQGCHDDTFDRFSNVYPEGETMVKVSFDFSPLTNTRLAGRSTSGNAPDGNVIKKLNDFSILFYDTRYKDENTEGRLTYVRHFSASDVANRTNGITLVNTQTRTDGDASNGQNVAETETMHVEATLNGVPYGPYIIYAVANLGGRTSTTQSVLDNAHIELNSPVEDLAFVKAKWDATNMLNNAQMTGFFTEEKQVPSPGTASKAEIVSINQPNMSIHSWLRRLVSKLTIDYDPSGLRSGVTVTIKKVTVRDIAPSCYLIQPNKIGPVDADGLINTDELINNDDNHCIIYDEPLVLTSKTTDYPQSPDFKGAPHRESDPALFFFENMQGEVPDKDNNGKLQDGKLQDQNGDGKIDYPNANDKDHPDYKDYKDGLKYGTYIEVEAEYDAKTIGHIGRGQIRYRFMIGNNVTTNCDAERNHHYKLKMRFMGNANEVDWHIEYDENPGFYGPNPYYVSYGYNRMTYYPIKISGKLDKTHDVTLTIVQNAWWPNNALHYDYFAKSGQGLTPEGKDTVGIIRANLYHPTGDKNSLEPWGGFLSLAQDMDNQNTNVALGLHIVGANTNEQAQKYLYNYWIGKNATVPNINGYVNYTKDDSKMVRNTRSYKVDSKSDPNNNRQHGTYTITSEPNSTTFNVPLFTREKQIQKTTGYTGNNPYVGYEREAKMVLQYKLEGEKVRQDTIKVYQVRRIVNPKGVWRSHNNTTPFRVTLKYQETEISNTFKDLKSVGPWRAYISRGNTDFITLNGKTEVRGGDQTEISFSINFRGPILSTDNQCAVIRIEYNNYSCHHLIFVRQGSAPIRMNVNSNVRWHLANISSAEKNDDAYTVTEGATPLDEGSMFKYANLDLGITSKCNTMYAKEANGQRLEPIDFDPVKNSDPEFALLSNGKTGKWSSMSNNAESAEFPDVKIKGKGENLYRVAKLDDFKTLIPNGSQNEEMDFGYGVLYGNDATETASTIEEAYGYNAYDSKTKSYGMRGVFVYNSKTSVAQLGGNNIFFPIGQSGYGRRRANTGWADRVKPYSQSNGVLQYATRSRYYTETEPNDAKFLPLFYDLFRSHGALYWPKKIDGTQRTLDINYHTLDFNISDLGHNGTLSDACFVRLVEDFTPPKTE